MNCLKNHRYDILVASNHAEMNRIKSVALRIKSIALIVSGPVHNDLPDGQARGGAGGGERPGRGKNLEIAKPKLENPKMGFRSQKMGENFTSCPKFLQKFIPHEEWPYFLLANPNQTLKSTYLCSFHVLCSDF